MSYDFRLFKPKPGEDLLVTAESESDDFGTAPVDPVKESTKRRVAAALIAKNPKLKVFEFDYDKIATLQKISVEQAKLRHRHLELNGSEEGCNGIQITLFDDEASVTVPYWHSGDKARETFHEIWDYLELISQEAGYAVYDPQRGEILELSKGVDHLVSGYVSTVDRVQNKSGQIAASAKEPWWKFW